MAVIAELCLQLYITLCLPWFPSTRETVEPKSWWELLLRLLILLAHMLDYLTDKLSRGCQAEPVSLEAEGLFVRERVSEQVGVFVLRSSCCYRPVSWSFAPKTWTVRKKFSIRGCCLISEGK
ncbi:hypothetical protein M758_9G174600 [Ceratodon purpureus]|nr:hypothetical protein M758_9G174600 [Ceratodon purpureus]